MKLKKPGIGQAVQAGGFVICAFLALQFTNGLEGTEFGGGWLTGPLLSMAEIGTVLFILAFVLIWLFPRVAAGIGLASCLLCLPLYGFFIAPVPFAHVFARGHEFKVQPAPGLNWHTWPAIALIAIAVVLCMCIHRLTASGRMQIPVASANTSR